MKRATPGMATSLIEFFSTCEDSISLAYASQSAILSRLDGHFQEHLSEQELLAYNGIGDRKYSAAWTCARFVAKELIQKERLSDGACPQNVTIRSRDTQNKGISPIVWCNGHRLPVHLSISHTDEAVLVALARPPQTCVGVDLVRPAEVETSKLKVWFSPHEQAISRGSATASARIWASKEAVYKALQRGEGFSPLRIEVQQFQEDHCNCYYRSADRTQQAKVRFWDTGDGHLAALAITAECYLGASEEIVCESRS